MEMALAKANTCWHLGPTLLDTRTHICLSSPNTSMHHFSPLVTSQPSRRKPSNQNHPGITPFEPLIESQGLIMETSPDEPLPGQTRRSRAFFNWSEYLVKDLASSDEGWEISMALKDLAEKYESYDETFHPFGDGYNIRWKRWFVLLFQAMLNNLPNGVVDLEKRIETLERPAAPNQLGPAIIKAAPKATPAVNITSTANVNSTAVVSSNAMVQGNNAGNVNNTRNVNNTGNAASPNNKKRPADAMDPGGNSHDTLHPNKRVMTQTSNDGVLLPGPILSVDTQSDYTVRIVEGTPPTFEFKANGPAKVHFNMGYSGVPTVADFGLAPRAAAAGAAAQAPRPIPAPAPDAGAAPGAPGGMGRSVAVAGSGPPLGGVAVHAPRAPGATAGPSAVAPRAPTAAVAQDPGGLSARAPGGPDTVTAPGILDVSGAPGAIAAPGNVAGPDGAIATPSGVIVFPGTIPSPGAAVTQAPAPAPPPVPAYVVPASARPSPGVVAFADRASNAAPDVENARQRTGWEGMGCRDDYESSISSSGECLS